MKKQQVTPVIRTTSSAGTDLLITTLERYINGAPSRIRCKSALARAIIVFIFVFTVQSSKAQWTYAGPNIHNTNTGNVGIGTPTPENSEGWDRVLEVRGRDHSKIITATQSYARTDPPSILFPGVETGLWSRNSGYYGAPAGGMVGTASRHPFSIITNKISRLTIATNGNVGIATTLPTYKLDVNGSVRIGGFTTANADEWPNVVWLRDEANNWDEGLMKVNNTHSVFGRAGFGIHMHESRHFGFYSTGWNPLVDIEGGTGRMYIKGDVGIGITNPGTYKLNVGGRVRANEVVVNTTGADFVFQNNYRLRSLQEVEQFIQQNKHLPEISSAAQMQKEGVGIGELQTKLLQKIEELTLYIIQINKEKEATEAALNKRIEALEKKDNSKDSNYQ